MFFWISCNNNIKEVQLINAGKNTPDESMKGVKMVYSDNGKQRAVLNTPLIHKFSVGQQRTEFPEGLTVDFYDKDGNRESYIEAQYGIVNQQNQLVLQNNVQMINFVRQDTLDTDYLIWKMDSAIVTTDRYYFYMHGVKGKSEGHYFRARENFTRYSWKKVKALYNYNQTDSL